MKPHVHTESHAVADVRLFLDRLAYTRLTFILGFIAIGPMLFIGGLLLMQFLDMEGKGFLDILAMFVLLAIVIVGAVMTTMGLALFVNRQFVRANLCKMMTKTKLAYWTYTLEEWQLYADYLRRQHETDKQSAQELTKSILKGAAVFAVFGCIVGLVAMEIFWQMFLGCTLCGLAFIVTAQAGPGFFAGRWYRRISRRPGPVLLSTDGLFLHSRYEFWNTRGRGKIHVRIDKWQELTLLIFVDRFLDFGNVKSTFMLTVPVPLGQESVAAAIAEQFRNPDIPGSDEQRSGIAHNRSCEE